MFNNKSSPSLKLMLKHVWINWNKKFIPFYETSVGHVFEKKRKKERNRRKKEIGHVLAC